MKFIRDGERRYPLPTSKQKVTYAIYECPYCHKEVECSKHKVEKRGQKSCKDCVGEASKTHGMWGESIYKVWDVMRQRCNNEKSTGYKWYGALGIKVCDEWATFEGFYEWVKISGYKDDLTIDRIDGSKNYMPSNCRWATKSVQSRNTRLIQSNNVSGYRGVAKSRNKYSAQIKVNYKKVHLGMFEFAIDGARAYDKYVKDNNLEHTLNFPED